MAIVDEADDDPSPATSRRTKVPATRTLVPYRGRVGRSTVEVDGPPRPTIRADRADRADEEGVMTTPDQILVGIDGSAGGRAAIRYAIAQAQRWHADVRLVHVIPEIAPVVSASPMANLPLPVETRRVGAGLLAEAAKEAGAALGADRVSTTLLAGRPVAGLVHAAPSARLVVLGDEPRPILKRLSTGAVLGAVAAHAPAPVVAVPASWRPGEGSRRVVAAIKDCEGSVGLIARALQEAAERDAELVLLHAWALPTAYDDLTVARLDQSEWEMTARRALEQGVDHARARLPERTAGLAVRIEVHHGQAARVIADAAADADLLLIGRRRHLLPEGHLGSTGRAVLRTSPCPVEVLPPDLGVVERDGLALEHDGIFEKEKTQG
ncbi:MAG: universal stress protein [Nocardioides sp.]|uniref:universal stress protein n=1 Tax=Nocardioides sp. TaxID=35761 RepID=UPI0039E2A612